MAKDTYSILAGKGRNGDKHIRKVFGEPSHVNEVEKDAIDIYGLLGEIFTKGVGSGNTNPETGLTEYDIKKTSWDKWWLSASDKDHNSQHDSGKIDNEHRTRGEAQIESKESDKLEEGETLLESDKTAGQLNLGQTVLKAEDYKGMTPDAIVNDIFAKQYNGIVPPKMADAGMDVAKFKAYLAGQLENMPQFGEADETKMGFLGETKDIAGRTADLSERRAESSWDATKYGLQGQAGKVGSMLTSGYGGGGGGMRGAIGAQNLIGQGFETGLETRDIALDAVDISRDTADLGYREGAYGLEQQAGADWESGFQSFLTGLPEPA